MLTLYKILVILLTPLLWGLLFWRRLKGKEDQNRIKERRGIASRQSPSGRLIWIHAASVGEAQSALILIDRIQKISGAVNFLITSGTVTSASLMAKRLPYNAFHQYVPLDHPLWINRFLDHWQPDLILWMESELWPATIDAIKRQNIPLLLINARLSDHSFRNWKIMKPLAKKLMRSFSLILTQTEKDKSRYKILGAEEVIATDNIKYSANKLPCDKIDLKALQDAIQSRPTWVYASTHAGEEELATEIHHTLKEKHPDLLTIIIPRHPERREELKDLKGSIIFRGEEKKCPSSETEIYIADTLGELGLFYTLSPIAMIGRSFSDDGGGGHNPIEAAQLNCTIMTGPNIQYQQEIFNALFAENAAIQFQNKQAFLDQLNMLLTQDDLTKQYQERALKFAGAKNNAVNEVIDHIMPYLPKGGAK